MKKRVTTKPTETVEEHEDEVLEAIPQDEYPGQNPAGSVTAECRSGGQVTVPSAVAEQISVWLEAGREQGIDDARVYDDPARVVVVSWPAGRKATFVL